MWIYDFAFCCKFGEMSQIHVFRGAAQIITILHRGVIKIYYNIPWGGGPPNLLQYYNGGGSLGTLNLYYVIYGRPLIRSWSSLSPPSIVIVLLLIIVRTRRECSEFKPIRGAGDNLHHYKSPIYPPSQSPSTQSS